MNHQLVSMVVAGNLAAEKRGSVGGGELEAGSCVRVFCCPTFLIAPFIEILYRSRTGWLKCLTLRDLLFS